MARPQKHQVQPSAKELVAYIARRLVNQPDRVYVTLVPGAAINYVVLEVAKTDYGRMIGRGGQVADAIRALLRVFTLREGKFYDLDVVHAAEDMEPPDFAVSANSLQDTDLDNGQEAEA